MKSGTVILAVVFILCIFLMIQPSVAQTINTGEADNGRLVVAHSNDLIVLTLPENPSTGYLWDMAATQGVTLLSGTFQHSQSLLIGAGGKHVWTYQVTGTGTQVITGVYHRTWVPPSPVDRKFTLSVQVEPTNSGKQAAGCPYGICKQIPYPAPCPAWPAHFGIFF